MENYDDDKMRVIQATIENCSRLLEGKKNKILEYYDSNKNDIKTSINVISCNDIIRDYIDGSISYEDVLLKINEEIKDDMIEILKQD